MRYFCILLALGLNFFSALIFASPKLVIASGTDIVVFDREELEAFPQTTIVTQSPFFDGEVRFTGPTVKRIIDSFELSGNTQIKLHALNDYSVTASVKEILSLDAIIATRQDSKIMSVRNRGPFWVMLPLSNRPELDHENYHRFMIWQLSRITLESM